MTPPSSPAGRSRRRLVVFVLILVAIVAAVVYWLQRERPPEPTDRPAWAGNSGPRPAPVRVVEVERRDVPRYIDALGTAVPFNTVVVRPQVSGVLQSLHFEEGGMVKAGQLLAEIDPRPFQVQLRQAEGQQQQQQAQLQNARNDLERFRQLQERNFISAQQLERQQSLVREYEGSQAAQRAQVDNAKLQLDYTRLTAPLSGRIGMRRLDPGNLISASDTTGLATITQLDPMAIRFAIPETDVGLVRRSLSQDGALPVEIWSRGERIQLATGDVRALDSLIDTTTGTLQLKATVDNSDDQLFPNQFVNVRLRVTTEADALVVPTDTLQFGAKGTYVYVIDDEQRARARAVRVGAASDQSTIILEGLAPGERVVLEGLDSLFEGRPVVIAPEATAS